MATNPFAKLGEIGEEVEQGMVQHAKAAVSTAQSQITGQTPQPQKSPPMQSSPKPISQESGTNEAASAAQPADDQATKDFVKELYAPSDNLDKNTKTQMGTLPKANGKPKTPAEMQKIKALTQQLHAQAYYQPTFERPKGSEERQGEKREEEEEQKSQQLEALKEDEKKKGPPLAVQQASLAHERKFGSG